MEGSVWGFPNDLSKVDSTPLGIPSFPNVLDLSEVDSTPLGLDGLYELQRELIPIPTKWKSIGVALRLDPTILDRIETRNMSDPVACMTSMVKEWLKWNYSVEMFGEPTWQRLVEAVRDPVGGNDMALAAEIARRHKAHGISNTGIPSFPNVLDLSEVDSTPLDEDDLFDVRQELNPVSAEWKSIGFALRLPLNSLDSIEASSIGDPPACLTSVVKVWLVRNYNVERFGPPTWQRLVEAVAHPAGGANRALSQKIARRHKAEGLPPPPPTASTAATDSETACLRIGDKPEMWQLQKFVGVSGMVFEVVKEISTDWEKLAMALHLRGEIIREQRHFQAETACHNILQRWLNGWGRQPVTWYTLLDCLEGIGYGTLAGYLRKELDHSMHTASYEPAAVQGVTSPPPLLPEPATVQKVTSSPPPLLPEPPLVVMSDEEAQKIVDQALESGSIEQRNILAVVVGIAGSGKTSLISRLFHEKPPDRYTSTGIAEQSLRGLMHHIAKGESWKRLSLEEILKIFASFLPAGLPEADIASLAKNFTEEEEPVPTQVPSGKELSYPLPGAPEPEPSGTPPSPYPLEKSSASETMVSFVQTVQGSNKAALIELLHMIDTGGQPEFMEIMPSLIHNSNLTLLVLNLDQSLDEEVQFAFYENDTPFKRPLPSIRTNRQVICQLVRTLQAKQPKCKGSQHSQVSLIGTHRDCVEKKGKLHETLEAMNEEVKSIFKEDELMNEIVPVNLKEPDDDDKKVLEDLRQHISKTNMGVKNKIPFSFFMFEHEAIKCAEQKKQDRKVMVLSFEECVQVGTRLKMSREVVQAALIYFHHHNIFLYFQHVLPNVVFLTPQVPLDFVNAVVALAYKVRSVPIFTLAPKYKRFCKEGIITEEMLSDESLQLSDHFIPGIYDPKDAIKLFHHIYAIAPLGNEESMPKDQPPHTPSSTLGQKSSEEREYLMMTLLEDKPENDIQKYLPSSSKVAPLVIHFSSGCVPNGCFSNTISCLISMYNWKVSQTKKVPKCLAHNIVTLSGPTLPVTITMVNCTQHLEIHINTDNVEEEDLSDFCSNIRKTIFEAIKEKVFKLTRFEDLQVEPAFLCPCDPSHVATICRDSDHVCKDSYIVCSETDTSQGRLQEQHLFWFQVQDLEQKPKLKDLMEELVNISYKWYDLGIQLGLERKLGNIKSDNPENSQHRLSDVLSTWLKVEPRATWHTLCAALRSEAVDEKKLASNLVAKYVKRKHSCI